MRLFFRKTRREEEW